MANLYLSQVMTAIRVVRVGSVTRNKYTNAPPPLHHVNVTRSTCAASLPHVQNARDRFHSPSWRQTRPPQGLDVTLGHCGFAGCRQTRTMVAESARCHRPLLGRHSPHPGRAGTPWGASPGASIGGCHTCLGGPHMFKFYTYIHIWRRVFRRNYLI